MLEANDDTNVTHTNIEGESSMKKNVFDKGNTDAPKSGALTRDELRTIFTEARQSQSTLKNAFPCPWLRNYDRRACGI